MKKEILAFGLVIATGVAVAIAGGAAGLMQPDPGDPVEAVARADGTPVVRTVMIEPAAGVQTRQFFGRLRARETVDLALEVGGTLARLMPEEGARVIAGETLAQLRLDTFERAVTRAELEFQLATREAERARRLADTAAGPASRAQDAATVRDRSAVALRDARAALEDATLTAPFDGLVAARLVPAHSNVAAGQPVLRLHDMSELRVELSIPERLFGALGGLDTVTFTALLPEGTAPLRLVAFQPEAGRVGQSFRVTLALPPEAGQGLVPGASVTVIAAVPADARGVEVPAEAVLAGNDRSAAVFVLEDGGDGLRVRRLPVRIEAPAGTGFAVSGLPASAEIVAAGAQRLRDGQAVRRFSPLTFAER